MGMGTVQAESPAASTCSPSALPSATSHQPAPDPTPPVRGQHSSPALPLASTRSRRGSGVGGLRRPGARVRSELQEGCGASVACASTDQRKASAQAEQTCSTRRRTSASFALIEPSRRSASMSALDCPRPLHQTLIFFPPHAETMLVKAFRSFALAIAETRKWIW
eukprot:2229938-Rhodomonas_salina.1